MLTKLLTKLENAADWAALLARRTIRAWKYYRRLRYSWHLAWHKAGWQTCD